MYSAKVCMVTGDAWTLDDVNAEPEGATKACGEHMASIMGGWKRRAESGEIDASRDQMRDR